MTNALAEITEYAPPYWKERAWILDQFHDWEQELLIAVKVGGQTSIEDVITEMEMKYLDEVGNSWGRLHGKTRVFALDYNPDIINVSLEYVNEDSDRMHPKAHAPQLRQWRRERAARFVPFDPTLTDNMINDLSIVEEGVLEELRWKYLAVDDELSQAWANDALVTLYATNWGDDEDTKNPDR